MADKPNLVLTKQKMSIGIFPSIILVTYAFVDLIRLFEVVSVVLGNFIFVVLGLISIIYSVLKNGIRRQLPIIYFIWIYTFFGALGILLNGNMELQELIWPFAFMGVATLFLNFTINYKLTRVLYYFVVILFISSIILSNGVDNLNMSSSRNAIGLTVLIYFSIYAISGYIHNRNLTIYPIIMGLIVSTMAIGRSGILVFLVILFLFLLFSFNRKKLNITFFFKSIFVGAFVVIILSIFYNFLEIYFTSAIINYENRGLESLRTLIWTDYLNKTFTSAGYFLFGAPISGTFILERFSQNLHNSFLMLHAKYGIVPFIIVILLVIKAFFHFKKENNLLYSMLLITLLFRMQFDYTNFNAQLDIILFYIIFSPYMSIHDDNKNRRVGKVKEL
ncbi:hypothetical protein ACFQ3N_01890 [Virgibacillus byunsanensis]|uniref:O-antigen ligase domain-containing protein n=1 Tax=Virgibacillus byunsanensis TaxID=570945 RepID=A0ABW3LIZ3_9BACI